LLYKEDNGWEFKGEMMIDKDDLFDEVIEDWLNWEKPRKGFECYFHEKNAVNLEDLRLILKVGRAKINGSTSQEGGWNPSPQPQHSRESHGQPEDGQVSGTPDPGSFSTQRQEIREISPPVDRVDLVNKQQTRLHNDDRVKAQTIIFKEAETNFPETFYADMSACGLHILQQGQAAQTSFNVKEADFLALDREGLESWLKTGTGDKLILYRDFAWR
jgi:hypothetical protein